MFWRGCESRAENVRVIVFITVFPPGGVGRRRAAGKLNFTRFHISL